MPNFTQNMVRFEASSQKIEALLEAIQDDMFDFGKFIPQPSNVRKSANGMLKSDEKRNTPLWHTWNVENWGTKWTGMYVEVCEKEKDSVTLFFLTANHAPDRFFSYMQKNGYNLVGGFINEEDDKLHVLNKDMKSFNKYFEFEQTEEADYTYSSIVSKVTS